MSQQFLIDKQLNLPIEEIVAPMKIREWYAAQGKRIQRIEKNKAPDNTPEQAAWDLIDTFGLKWEVKWDKKYHQTGNFFLEHESVLHSTADYFLLLTFLGHVITGQQARDLIADSQFRIAYGGEQKRMKGSLIPVSCLMELTQPI